VAPDPVARGRLEAAFSTYGRLRAEAPAARPSIDGLLSGSSPPATPASSAPAPAEPPPVSIETLCYRGRGALERAAEIRRDLQLRLASDVAMTELRPLIEELLDLVPLALAKPD
jgi:hypothetical protein